MKQAANPRQVDPKHLRAHPKNGETYTHTDDHELVDSVKEYGVIVPLIVAGTTIISGHRRWLAAEKADLKTVPVIDLSEVEDNLDLLQLLLECNRSREKTNLERARELKLQAEIIEQRRGREGTLPTHERDHRRISPLREAHEKLGISKKTAQRFTAVLERIDALRAEGDEEAAESWERALNKSAKQAHEDLKRVDGESVDGSRGPSTDESADGDLTATDRSTGRALEEGENEGPPSEPASAPADPAPPSPADDSDPEPRYHDQNGTPVPESLHPVWELIPKFDEVLDKFVPRVQEHAFDIQRTFFPGAHDSKIAPENFRAREVCDAVERIFGLFNRWRPRSVCDRCSGQGCNKCKGRGWAP